MMSGTNGPAEIVVPAAILVEMTPSGAALQQHDRGKLMTKDEATALLAGALRDIAPEVDLGAVDRDLPLQEVADIDSISFMALVTSIGDRTGIQIPVQDYPELATVNSFVAYLMAAPRPVDSV
jgi:acyl carrier protein